MGDEYNNLNAQDLYDKFEKKYKEKYNEKYNSPDKKDLPGYWKWLKHYFKLELTQISVIVLLVIVVLYKFFKKPLPYWTMFILVIIFFVLGYVADLFFGFSSIEKLLAEKTIDEIFEEEKINLTEKILERIINDSRNVASREGNIFREVKKIVVNSTSKAVIYSFFGIIAAYITFINQKSSVEQFFKDLDLMFKMYFIIFVILVVIFTVIYCIGKNANRKKELYLEVLEDKRLTLCLKNDECTEFVEEEINYQKNEEDIDKKDDDIRQEKEDRNTEQISNKKFTTSQNDKINSNVLGAIGIVMIANKIFAIKNKRKDSRKRRR